ncbi:MAG: hypothetical protein A2639_03020 [Candidatus Staskawiczbacteria bacterium RIFCSPHIGHO2_01_FULL_34_27]|uniref:G8 domain-containing protein n=1 Tax=Candidatus Staskawiczbacteria bacterium RIFCSPHIGHO2_01_FULL_34_27 TaxID=1802199 RepID=A0A1G2HKU8_9BACT|nr:MAG: hypothetical protein A2639_03020 [Candidatus Staskawiczbacteria bacterium RIFCSPHIGHO2_01_FULL_34_27]
MKFVKTKILLFSLLLVAGVLVFIPTAAHAATRTIADGGGNWNSTGTWVEGAVPTSADDVVATATSGNLTINAAATARSFDLTGYVRTVTHSIFISLSIGDATAGVGDNALIWPSSGWTYTGGTVSNISFVSTSATVQNVNFGGKAMAGLGQTITFNGVGGSWKLTGAINLTNTTSATVTLTNGTLDTNGQTVTATTFYSNNSNTRTLTLGASSINVSELRNALK